MGHDHRTPYAGKSDKAVLRAVTGVTVLTIPAAGSTAEILRQLRHFWPFAESCDNGRATTGNPRAEETP